MTSIASQLNALQSQFAEGLDGRLKEIEKEISSIETTWGSELFFDSLLTISAFAHKLAGTAGTFNFYRVYEAALKLEGFCDENRTNEQLSHSEIIECLESYLLNLQLSVSQDQKAFAEKRLLPKQPTASSDEFIRPSDKTLLLVEDDDEQAKVLEAQLANFGFRVQTVSRPADVANVKFGEPQSPSLILMDIMIGRDRNAGLDFVREMRRQGDVKVPIIFITARDDVNARIDAVRSGADGYMVKPVDIIELVDSINRLINIEAVESFEVLIMGADEKTVAVFENLLQGTEISGRRAPEQDHILKDLNSNPPDVILMNAEFPDYTGVELAGMVRQVNDFLARIPIVYFSEKKLDYQQLINIRSIGDDVFELPVEPDNFILSLRSRAKRMKTVRKIIKQRRNSDRLFSAIFETTNEAVIVANERGLIVLWNRGAEGIFGHAASEIIGSSLLQVFPDQFHESDILQALKGRSVEYQTPLKDNDEIFGKTKNGREFPIELTYTEWADEDHKYHGFIIRDVSERHKAEVALEQNRKELAQKTKLLQATFDNIDQGFVVWDDDQKLAAVSQKCREFWYDPPEEVTAPGAPMEKLLLHLAGKGAFGPGDPEEIVEQHYQRIIDAGNKSEEEITLLDERLLHVKRFPIPGVGRVAKYTDITEEREFENRLIESQNRFRDFASSAGDRFWETDEEFRFTYLSDMPSTSDRPPAEELLGVKRWEIDGLDMNDESWAQLKETIKAREPIRGFQSRRVRADGKVKWIRMNAIPFYDKEGEFKGYRGTNSDVTEYMEAQIIRSRVFSAMESLEAGFVLWGADRKLIACNNTFKKQQGETAKYLEPGIDFETYINLVAAEQIEDGEEIVDTEKWIKDRVEEFTLEFVDREVKYTDDNWLRIRKRQLSDGSMLAFHQDINDIKRHEQQLSLAVESAEKANRAKSEFLSSMSHELRTPMNAILGFGQLLENNPKEPVTEMQAGHIRQILKGGEHLLDLIDQVLELSKIESGALNLEWEHFYPSEVFRECLELVAPMAEKRSVTMSGNQGDIAGIRVDRKKFMQIILNLMSNGIKYNNEGGELNFGCKPMTGDQVRIFVNDTGPGIPIEKQNKIFQPFNRLGRERTEIEGTGIGLTITKKLVEAMNGQIGFESTPGIGSTFWVDFPEISEADLTEQEDKTESDQSDPIQGASPNGVVLYVEDNIANLELMQAVIERLPNLNLMSAENAEIGISMAEEYRPNLILMDINLPGMDGIDALGKLRQNGRTKEIPVIAVSAAAMPKEIERGKAAGFDEYVTKPIDVPKILNAISNLIER